MTRSADLVVIGVCLLAMGTPPPAVADAPRHAASTTAAGNPLLKATLDRCRTDLQAFDEALAAGEDAVDGLAELVHDRNLALLHRYAAANVLGDIGSPKAVKPLLKALRDPDQGVRRCAAAALGRLRDPSVRPALEKLAKEDPFVFRDPKTGKLRYLVREDAREALDVLSGRVTPGSAGLRKMKETFLEKAWKPPTSKPAVPVRHPVWPFKGDFKAQNIWNNYQQPTDLYIHAGLDFIQNAGTEVLAVEDGHVAAISTNYLEWKTHQFFVVTTEKDGKMGWCYTHVDPDTYTFKVGDKVRQGQVLGKIVDFYVGKNKGADHLHLHYVEYKKTDDGKIEVESLVDPLLFFDWQDTAPPQIDKPLRFVRKGTMDEFTADQEGVVIVSGRVEIVAGISDTAYAGQACNWMVPVVTLEIAGEKSTPWRKLVLDQRGDVRDPQVASTLYLSGKDAEPWMKGRPRFPSVYWMKVTSTDGNGVIEPSDRLQAWDTAERDEAGRPRFPDGLYKVIVRAWDLQGNQTSRTATVRLANQAQRPEGAN